MAERGYFHVWLTLVAAVAVAVFVCLWFVDIYRPSIAAAGTVSAIGAAAYALLSNHLKRAWQFLIPHIGTLLGIVDRHKKWAVACSLLAIILSAIGIQTVLNGFIDRYRYVNIIRGTVAALRSETAKLPDTADLAYAFTLYPGRKEVPVLLVRTGRIFSHGDDWSKFIAFQKSFAKEIEDFVASDAICNVRATHHDPVAFAALVTLEAGVALDDGQPKDDQGFLQAAAKSITLLNRCGKTIERSIHQMRIQDQVNDVENKNGSDIDSMLEGIEDQIASLSPEGTANLFQTHAFQEYLDFRAHRIIADILKMPKVEASWTVEEEKHRRDQIGEITRQYRRILSLRSAIGADGDVLWYTGPGKLNLYRLFMAIGGFKNSINNEFVETVTSIKDLDIEIKKLVQAPAFKNFQKPDAWFRATPLDLSLEGGSLDLVFNQWLKAGW